MISTVTGMLKSERWPWRFLAPGNLELAYDPRAERFRRDDAFLPLATRDQHVTNQEITIEIAFR